MIGAGPAGLAASARIAEASSARVVVIDEAPVAGGRLRAQLYRRNRDWFIGSDAAQALTQRAEDAGVRIETGRQVWSLEPGFALGLSGGEVLSADYVVIATGAAEKALGLPGWTLPGVLAVGAVQTMLNVNRIVPGRRLAVIGIDPLSLSIVDELAAAGISVEGLYLPPPPAHERPGAVFQRLGTLHTLAPNRLLGVLMKLLQVPAIAEVAARMWPRTRVRIAGMPMHLRECVVGIDGGEEVTGLRVRTVTAAGAPIGKERMVPVDSVCLSGGLYPLQDLAHDCHLVDIEELGGRVPLHGPDLETTVPGLYVAGNITGIESAEVARAQGELAGAAISAQLEGCASVDTACGAVDTARAAVDIARAAVETARAEAPLRFMPDIDNGRRRMGQLWHGHLNDEVLR